MTKAQIRQRLGGVSANAMVLPIVLTLAALHVAIISVIFMINTTSSELSTIMQHAGVYTQDATSLLAGSSLLSETCTNFVLAPVTETGEVNVMPMNAYAQELAVERRPDQVMARFSTYDVDGAVVSRLSEAADSASYMLESQLHAIALVSSVYPLPEIQPIASIPKVELTEEELAMPDEARMGAARGLVLGSVYALNKQSVSQNVNGSVEILQANSAIMSAQAGRRIAILRKVLWGITLTIIVILIVTFATLYTRIMHPLKRFVQLIPQNRPLEERRGFREVRLVAAAYNDVLKRRDALDAILKSAAETDALTNLPNRYRFEQYLLESEESGYSMAMLLFDVNYLKKTNDTQGHLAGDQLIRSAASCISSCFGENCFRFGGDEFAAIIKDCTPESIDKMVRQFKEVEQRENVSISMGYAYTKEIGDTTFKQLLDEADRNMYVQKQKAHRHES